MKLTTQEDLRKRAAQPKETPTHYLRVGMDTGGVAAGAKTVYRKLMEKCQEAGVEARPSRVGSLGLSFADPVVEVACEGMPTVIYGAVDVEIASQIVDLHLGKNELVNGHAIFSPELVGECPACAKTYLLVRDTSEEGGDKTNYYHFSLAEEIKRQGLSDKVQVVSAFDLGVYDEGVSVAVLPQGIVYTNVLAQDVSRIVSETLVKGEVLEGLAAPRRKIQRRVVLRNCGKIDPENIGDYLDRGGYQGFRRVLFDMTPEEALEELKVSGLRGRGGAGFPTWLKWKLTRDPVSDEKYVICNADEGDPGAFMDRSVLESDPHSVLEGLLIAARCIGATRGYFYIRAEYPMAIARVQRAIDEAREVGMLGENILDSGFSFDAKVRLGAGAFVCGEETALIASIEGKRGSPTPRPPFPSVRGLFGKPTSINNVETLAAVPAILAQGGTWYAEMGTDTSRGTKVFAVTGKVRNAQLVEVPMGTSLREIVFNICGGVLDRKEIKAVQTGGPSGGVIPEKFLDTQVSYETLKELGSIMGSGGMLVMDENDCMVDVAKFYLKFCVEESCGKCAPCRVGGYQMLQILERIARGMGKAEDIDLLHNICTAMQRASLCGLGQTAPNPVLSTLKYFHDEYIAYIEGGRAYARKMRKLISGSDTERQAS